MTGAPPAGWTLAGRRALVTGSSEGIGRAIAVTLARAGAEVVAHGLEDGADAAALREEIAGFGGKVRSVAADFEQSADVEALIAAAGPVDILVSNVAIQHRQSLDRINPDAMEQQFRINVRSAVRLIQAVLPHMRQQSWGRIVTIGSVQEAKPHPDMLIYAGLKSAQANMVRSIARQVAADGVTVNSIAPGVILTGRSAPVLEDAAYRALTLSKIPAAAFGRPEDIAGAALLLCSDAGRYITGANLAVDGGMSL